MKLIFVALFALCAACSSVKTRKEAAEEAKLKAATEQTPPPMSPITEDESSPESYPATGEAEAQPLEDQVLDDELAAIGIDPSNPSGEGEGTPEPESNAEDEDGQAAAEPVKRAVKKKKPVKKSAKKKKKKN